MKRRNNVTWSTPAREVPRHPYLRNLLLTYEGHSEAIPVRTPDLSPRGMFINVARCFPEGSVLNLRFELPRTGVEVRARCEVRYCLAGVGIGVEFLRLSPRLVRAIEKEISLSNHGRRGGRSGRRS